MVRSPCHDEMNVKRGFCSSEEDSKICICKHGNSLSRKAGLKRCGKSCRLRWNNHLKPDVNDDSFTRQEEELIVKLHATLGSRWTIIAQQLPGRTDTDVKNYWNTKLRKKLFDMGIDPVTHKPFSQILADYGNIGGLSKSGIRIGSLCRDLKNAFGSRPEQNLQNLEQNHSLDLLDQIQAIKLAREASRYTNYDNITPQFLVEGSTSSPSSSSSSTCSTAAQEKSAMGFSWRDFLVEDELLPGDDYNGDSGTTEFSSKEFRNQINVEKPEGQVQTKNREMEGGVPGQSSHGNETVVPLHSSFVDAILEQENDMFMEFPNLLNEPLFF